MALSGEVQCIPKGEERGPNATHSQGGNSKPSRAKARSMFGKREEKSGKDGGQPKTDPNSQRLQGAKKRGGERGTQKETVTQTMRGRGNE